MGNNILVKALDVKSGMNEIIDCSVMCKSWSICVMSRHAQPGNLLSFRMRTPNTCVWSTKMFSSIYVLLCFCFKIIFQCKDSKTISQILVLTNAKMISGWDQAVRPSGRVWIGPHLQPSFTIHETIQKKCPPYVNSKKS